MHNLLSLKLPRRNLQCPSYLGCLCFTVLTCAFAWMHYLFIYLYKFLCNIELIYGLLNNPISHSEYRLDPSGDKTSIGW
jgi:hypothetical protein